MKVLKKYGKVNYHNMGVKGRWYIGMSGDRADAGMMRTK